jgi:hypothetical protein
MCAPLDELQFDKRSFLRHLNGFAAKFDCLVRVPDSNDGRNGCLHPQCRSLRWIREKNSKSLVWLWLDVVKDRHFKRLKGFG